MAVAGVSSARHLIVAASGHRFDQLPEAERPRIQNDIARCLTEAELAAQKATGAPTRCILNSAIAEGADRYAAAAALARGWRLVTPLPLSVERYEHDFKDKKSKEEYQRLLWASRRIAPVSAEVMKSHGAGGAAPYAAVGFVLIQKADLLLSVWNGLPPRGPGGTAEVAALMLEKGGLVLWISPSGAEVKLIGPDPLPREGSFRRKLHQALAARFESVTRPPEMRIAA